MLDYISIKTWTADMMAGCGIIKALTIASVVQRSARVTFPQSLAESEIMEKLMGSFVVDKHSLLHYSP